MCKIFAACQPAYYLSYPSCNDETSTLSTALYSTALVVQNNNQPLGYQPTELSMMYNKTPGSYPVVTQTSYLSRTLE